MDNGKGDWTYYTGWIVAYCLTAGFFICLVLNGTFDRSLCTGAPDEHCFRDWVSALGGWAALIIGAPTLFILWKQVADAGKGQLIAFRIQLRRTRTLARRVLNQANELERAATFSIAFWDRSDPAHTKRLHPLQAYREALRQFQGMLQEGEFDTLESEIDVPATMTLRRLSRKLQENLELTDGRIEREFDLYEYNTAADIMLLSGRQVLEYAREVQRIAEDHLLEIKDIFPH
ncbi:hypothetical protein [Rhizobium rhizogenes]|uniref:Uncharacterized protein n=1 Tax=Rhizobium rhizogenes (strain K84 / ATCC BAA-868) TaxID=311403 RepID=B9J9E5_RHIR8|nr:hypothetical protein Arad_3645 [Rhizobium rhizogenes K84]